MEEKETKGVTPQDEAILTKIKTKIVFSAIITSIFVLMEIYTIINFKNAIIGILGIGVMIAGALFALISSIVDMSLKNKELERREFDEIYRAQKASYLIIRKSFDDLEERLASIESASALPADEIINAQKAVAKVTISRNKENTDALMNSNDELINQLFAFQEKIDSNNDNLMIRQQALMDSTKQDLLSQNQALQSQFDILKAKLESIEAKSAAPAPVVYAAPVAPVAPPVAEPVVPVAEPITVAPEPVAPVEEPIAVPEISEEILEEPVIEEEPVTEEPIIEEAPLEETPIEETPIEETPLEEAPTFEPSDDPNKIMSPDEIAALLASAGNNTPAEEPDSVIEEPDIEESVIEESPIEEAPLEEAPAFDPGDDPNRIMSPDEIAALLASAGNIPAEEPEPVIEEPDIEEPVIEEPPIEETPAFEPSDDPNKMMSPDDIAALLASMGNDTPAEEPEPEPVPEPEPIAIPDVSDIDLSDPNRVMSPEEIEKLFANL